MCPVATEISLDGLNRGKNAGRSCWVVAGVLASGTLCGWRDGAGTCFDCAFYQAVRDEEGDSFEISPAVLRLAADAHGARLDTKTEVPVGEGEPRALTRGTGFASSVSGMQARCAGECWSRVLQPLTPAERAVIADVTRNQVYELDVPDKLYRSFASVVCGDSLGAARYTFRSLGRHIAADDLSSVYRLVIGLQRPGLLARLLPIQWHQYFPGVEVETIEVDLRARRVEQVVRGLGGFGFISPVACGWIEHAFRRAGVGDVSVTESEFEAGRVASNAHHYTVRWE